RDPLFRQYAAVDDLLGGRFRHAVLHYQWRSGADDLYLGESRHPQRIRPLRSQPRRCLRDVGAAADDPARHFSDAQIAHDGRGAIPRTVIAVEGGARARSHAETLRAVQAARRRRVLTNLGAAILSVVLVIWSVLPIYNMIMVSLDSHSDVLSTHVFPPRPSANSYWIVFSQGYWYLQYFWEQFGRSVYLAGATVILTLSIASLAAYAVGRLPVRHGWLVTNAALLTYVIPASFLAIPFYRLMAQYGLMNNLWAVIASLVAFATPYAIFIFQQYGRSIPIELDEAARIDGASPVQIY